ncbi:hypothetical protein BS329_40185 [Amycolatopsis coloradensis]|uniref:Uncharacterized protein n=2 Tax=Amycolatopsis coloradensis TaxID=76021 RepID=A0A1R0KDV5_9PSEU|nr:hypothetical protein BS329_40185 [Amycolatopsis coloradensis]
MQRLPAGSDITDDKEEHTPMSKAVSMVFLGISGILLITLVVLAVIWPTTLTIALAVILALLFAYSDFSLKRSGQEQR